MFLVLFLKKALRWARHVSLAEMTIYGKIGSFM